MRLRAILCVLLLCSTPTAEEYQCSLDDGCKASTFTDGELVEQTFRKGDIISMEAHHWVFEDPEDGWVKVRQESHWSPAQPYPGGSLTFGFRGGVPPMLGGSIALAVPPDISLIGLYHR